MTPWLTGSLAISVLALLFWLIEEIISSKWQRTKRLERVIALMFFLQLANVAVVIYWLVTVK